MRYWQLFFLIFALIIPVNARTDDSGKKISQLTVAGPDNKAPYAFMSQNGVYTGFSVDMLRQAGEIESINTILFYPRSIEESLKELKRNEIDCINFVPYSAVLARHYEYAALYYESTITVFIKAKRFDIIDVSDLRNKKIAVLNQGPVLEKLNRLEFANVNPVDSLSKGFMQLNEESVDAFVSERLISLHYLGRQGMDKQFKMLDKELVRIKYGVLVNKDREQLKLLLRQAFKKLEKSGQKTSLVKRWFGEDVKPQGVYSRPIIRWVMIFIGTALLVSVIVLGWNLLLQRELELKAIAIEKVNLDKKIAEEKIRFEAIVQSMTEGLMLVEPDGLIAYVNAPGAQYLGRRIEDLLKQPITDLYAFLLPKVRKAAMLEKQFSYAEKNPAKPIAIEYAVTKTKRMDIRMKFFPVRDRQGQYAGRGILIEDVTHERELDRLKSEFVSIASHELRTPMTSILGFSEIILTKQLPADLADRYTKQIHSEAERLTRILNDMLDLSYLESGESGLEKQTLNMIDLTKEVVENFKAQLKDRREIKFDCQEQQLMVLADKDKLTQVLWNLLSNADKYSPSGKEVIIGMSYYRHQKADRPLFYEGNRLGQDGVVITITDFGQGIPEEQLSMIFIPFYRVETAVHTIRGTGLGLAIVKRIMEAHGGKVWATSKLGKQTRFTLFFPKLTNENQKGEDRA